MTQYLGDQNVVGFFFSSGTYATPSGNVLQSFGLVQNHTPDEVRNVSNIRYTGTDDRNVGQFVTTSKDYTGTVTFHPQDWKSMWLAMGSVVDTSGTISTHVISETNSDDGNKNTGTEKFVDFNVQDTHGVSGTKENAKRTFNGATVDSWTLTGTQGGLLSVDVNYTAQSSSPFASGVATTITASTTRPFIFSDCLLTIPSGTAVNNMTDFSFSINNNLLKRHYGNGSQVISQPKPLDRDYNFSVTVDESTDLRKTFYESYFEGGSTFNCMLQVGTAAARKAFIIMSGCILSDDSSPTLNSGANEEVLTIIPKTVSANVSDVTSLYTCF